MPESIAPYLYVFGSMMACGFGAPVPEEVPIIAGGVWCGKEPDTVHWWIMLPMLIVTIVIADGILYAIGRFGGSKLVATPWVERKLLPPEKRHKIEKNFHDYGVGVLLVTRLLPGIRSPIFIMAGVMKMPLYKFLLADGLYAIPGANLIFWLSFYFTDTFQAGFNEVEKHRNQVVLAILAAVSGVVIYKLIASRRLSTGDPGAIPFGDTVARMGGIIEPHTPPEESPPATEAQPTPDGDDKPTA